MAMKIELIGSTNSLNDIERIKRFGYNCGRICYSEKDFSEVEKEKTNQKLMEGMISSGHHSIFEHFNLSFYFNGIPKALAMILNNEKQYATSEKSARYTKMEEIEPIQNEKYNKWMNILIPEIEKVYPKINDEKKREKSIEKLAKENARYMTSVFTPTKMAYTVNLRQLNFILDEFDIFSREHFVGRDQFKYSLSLSMIDFLSEMQKYRIDGLENQTDRHLSFFSERKETPKEFFGDIYSTNYFMSLAGLAQAHRHRTINYQVLGNIELNSPNGFFIPEIIPENLKEEWKNDLSEISEKDFPQAQLINVWERGIIEDFRSKAFLRMCGHSQYEIMKNTFETAKKYGEYKNKFGQDALKPKCQQGRKCNEPCVWGGKKSLERIV